MLELCVVLGVVAAMFCVALPIWSHFGKSARDARAVEIRAYAEQAVARYWSEIGRDGSGYKNLTADRMNGMEVGHYWVDARTLLDGYPSFDNLPGECFSYVLIFKDVSTSQDEVGVAAVSGAGAVYFARFNGNELTEAGRINFSDFRNTVCQPLNADAGSKRSLQ
jgi:type II secretory pathway pseudopilin PulG